MFLEKLEPFKWFIYHLGFIGGILAIMGCFTFGAAVVMGDIAMDNRRLILAVFLFSSGIAWGSFRSAHFQLNGWYLIPGAVFTFAAFKSGIWLWILLH